MAVVIFGKHLLGSNIAFNSMLILLVHAVLYTISFFRPMDRLIVGMPASVLICTIFTAIFSFHFHFRQMVMTSFMLAWSGRLLAHIIWKIRIERRDDRFDNIRKNWMKRGVYFLIQDVMAFSYTMLITIVLSIRPEFQANWNFLDMCGLALTIFGLITSIAADHQLRTFKQTPDLSNPFLCTGVWKISRHPNYLGEIMFIMGMFMMSMTTLSKGEWVNILALLYLISMILFVTGVRPSERSANNAYCTCNAYLNYLDVVGKVFPKISFRRRRVLQYSPPAATQEESSIPAVPVSPPRTGSSRNEDVIVSPLAQPGAESPGGMTQSQALHSPYTYSPSSTRDGYAKLPNQNVEVGTEASGISAVN
ncbi:putative 3-oxo-5-alpha-steroid 4-dehydrogenase 1 [Blattamonas nauphoetae]|uniref:3-oxo-5-alpha-steroid 4-dehydrogenase 1 n=1 Tax=Blattamonas nauphoetae TaxID=2049346 RepID=A0ABQ9XDN6_9EUKA|nr:putative 3-oxo-5-alpha-steroid 4-dehydrogenase 1 [Blattamonas nauphoetae]